MKILKIIKRVKGVKNQYITLKASNTIKKDFSCQKPGIEVLSEKLNKISEGEISYEELTKEVVSVLLCGDIKIDTENKTVKVACLNKEKALIALSCIN